MKKEAPMSAQPRKVVHPDITPENTPELTSRYLDVPNMPWEATNFAGIRIKVLYSDESGITTALFKLDPGAVVPLHEHTALEQTFVLEGTLEDHEGVCGPGQFVWRPGAQRRRHPRLLPQAKSLCPRREVLHRGRSKVETSQCELPSSAGVNFSICWRKVRIKINLCMRIIEPMPA